MTYDESYHTPLSTYLVSSFQTFSLLRLGIYTHFTTLRVYPFLSHICRLLVSRCALVAYCIHHPHLPHPSSICRPLSQYQSGHTCLPLLRCFALQRIYLSLPCSLTYTLPRFVTSLCTTCTTTIHALYNSTTLV